MTQEAVALPSPLTLRVAAEIRAELGRQNRSQRWLAEQLGYDPAMVSRRMLGRGSAFNTAELDRVADVLQVSVDQLVSSRAFANAA